MWGSVRTVCRLSLPFPSGSPSEEARYVFLDLSPHCQNNYCQLWTIWLACLEGGRWVQTKWLLNFPYALSFSVKYLSSLQRQDKSRRQRKGHSGGNMKWHLKSGLNNTLPSRDPRFCKWGANVACNPSQIHYRHLLQEVKPNQLLCQFTAIPHRKAERDFWKFL